MTAEPQTEERQSNATNEDGGATGETTQEQPRAQTRQRAQQPADATARGSYAFDASGAVRVALLNLAHTMKEKGAIYQAINAYERILIRYPGTGAANAAVQELVELAGQLQRDGKIYTALNILTKLEENIG